MIPHDQPQGQTAEQLRALAGLRQATMRPESYTPAERMMVTLQSDLARMQAELDDVRAQSNLAMVWPKMGAGQGGEPADPTDPTRPGGEVVTVAHCYAFEAWSNVARTGIIMETGDILLGPLSFIDWEDIDGYNTTPAVTSTNTHVWLEVRTDSQTIPTGSLGAGYAWLKVGTKADMRAALDSTEILTKTVVPLVETVWVAGAITKVKGLQCGDAKLYRSG